MRTFSAPMYANSRELADFLVEHYTKQGINISYRWDVQYGSPAFNFDDCNGTRFSFNIFRDHASHNYDSECCIGWYSDNNPNSKYTITMLDIIKTANSFHYDVTLQIYDNLVQWRKLSELYGE